MSTNNNSSEELVLKFTLEMQQLIEEGIGLELSLRPWEAMALIGAVQLACRHPGFNGPSRQVVVQLIDTLQEQFAKYDMPITAEMIRRGWDENYDEEKNGG